MQFDNQTTRNVADIVARILAGESVKQEPKMLEEELVGNQHKIDANKNNKIDAHDFKLLRKKKKVEEETELDELDQSTLTKYATRAKFSSDPKRREGAAKAQEKINKKSKDMQKEELAESHFKVGDKVRCKESGMDGEITKLDKEEGGEDEKYYTFKREDGKVMKKAPNELSKINEEVDKKKKDLPFTPDTVKKPVRNSDGTIQSPISRARELAKQGLKRAMSKEEVEQIDELSKDTLKSYAGKVIDKTRTMPQGEKKQKHLVGLVKSMDKMKKEETEIDEAMFPGTKEYEKKFGESPQQKLKKKGDTVPTAQGEMKKTDKGVAHRRKFTEMIDSYAEGGLKYIATLVQEEPDNEEYTKEMQDQKAKMDGKKKGGDVAKASVQAVKNEETEIQVINADIANGVEQIDIEESAKETAQKALNLADKLRKKDPEKSKMYRNLGIKASQRSNNPTGVKAGQPHGMGNKALRKQGIEPVPSSMSSSKMRGYVEEVELEERSLSEPEMKKREEIVMSMKKKMPGFKERYGDRAKEVMYATATARAKGE